MPASNAPDNLSHGAGEEPRLLAQCIADHARRQPDKDAVVFLERGEDVTDRLSYATLHRLVQRYGAGLLHHGLRGKPMAILLPPGPALIALTLACLSTGVIVVPLPPLIGRQLVGRVSSILRDARPAAVVTVDGNRPVHDAMHELEATVHLGIGDLDKLGPDSDPDLPAWDAPALIQYTSGSTSAPRGVAITHANLMANLDMMRTVTGEERDSLCVSWLPHFHDMGLIGTIFQPLYVGGTTVLMPPFAFVQKPLRWLRAIHAFRATVAGAPCFAFELCNRLVPANEVKELDLSSWRVAFCGAEPIRQDVLEGFADRFGPAGFDRSAFTPCYGLAEATLMVSSMRRGTGSIRGDLTVRAGVQSPAARRYPVVRSR